MAQITFPVACEVCNEALNGTAKLQLEREGDEYYLEIGQTAKLDWGICPRCKLVSCFAFCWDVKRGYCKTCPSFDEAGNCLDCGKVLTGAVEIVETEMFGIPTIAFEETSDRNWIECDACSRIVCKACCRKPKTGYCNICLTALEKDKAGATATTTTAKTKPLPEQCPVLTAMRGGAFRFDAAQRTAAINTKDSNTEQSEKMTTGGQIK